MGFTVVEWTIVISLISLVLSISTMSYLMLVRIRQLTNELKRLNTKIEITDDELTRLCDDIEGCKKIIV